jgi:hypothetical protein
MLLHPALGEYDQWHPSEYKSGSYFRLIPKAGLLQIRITDTTKNLTLTVIDSTVGGNDASLAIDSITITAQVLNAAFGAQTVGGSTTISANSNNTGTVIDSFVALQSKFAQGTNDGYVASTDNFIIQASQTGFILPTGPNLLLNSSATGNFVASFGTSVSGNAYADGANILESHAVDGGLIGPFTPSSSGTIPFAGSGLTDVAFTGTPFSITATLNEIRTVGAGTVLASLTAEVTQGIQAVPEPATVLSLLGLIPLAALSLNRRLRRRSN